MTFALTLYGIPNCDTVKKARAWLQEQGLAYEFHDFKKNGLTRSTLEHWLTQQSLEVLINRKGTTWRTLTDEQKAAASETAAAIELMLAKPSVIKRPLLYHAAHPTQTLTVGFSAAEYQALFQAKPCATQP